MLKFTNISLFFSIAFIIATSSCTATNDAYAAARERFKERLCTKQRGLMSCSAYSQFIEPHLQKAEKELSIPAHLQTKPKLSFIDEHYMEELANCNVALFHSYVNPNSPHAEMDYARCERNLKSAIQNIKRNDSITVDVDSEFNKTAKLLTDANEKFYKKLDTITRIGLWATL